MDHPKESYNVETKRACGLLRWAVSSYYYQSHGHRSDAPVRAALRRNAALRRRWGYRRLLVQPRRDGLTDNHIRIHRIYREERLQVHRRYCRKQCLVRGQ